MSPTSLPVPVEYLQDWFDRRQNMKINKELIDETQ